MVGWLVPGKGLVGCSKKVNWFMEKGWLVAEKGLVVSWKKVGWFLEKRLIGWLLKKSKRLVGCCKKVGLPTVYT